MRALVVVASGLALVVTARPARADGSTLSAEDIGSPVRSEEAMPWYLPPASETYPEKQQTPSVGTIFSASLATSSLTSTHTFSGGDTLTGATLLLGYIGWRTFGVEGGVDLVKGWPVLGFAVNRYSGYRIWQDGEHHLRVYALMPSVFAHASGNFTSRGAHELGVDLTGVRVQYACRFFVEIRVPTIEGWVLVDDSGADVVPAFGLALSAGMF